MVASCNSAKAALSTTWHSNHDSKVYTMTTITISKSADNDNRYYKKQW